MINYVYLNFLPGAAGNFFSRCINLTDGCYCWANECDKSIPQTLDAKIKILSYDALPENWIEFERRLVHYSELNSHWDLPTDSFSIWPSHHKTDIRTKDIAGQDDTERVLQISVEDQGMLEWSILNAFYKNSFISVDWLKQYQSYAKDPSILQVKLKDFLDKNTFLSMFQTTTQQLNIQKQKLNLDAVEFLYTQWSTTKLDSTDFAKFKSEIGWTL